MSLCHTVSCASSVQLKAKVKFVKLKFHGTDTDILADFRARNLAQKSACAGTSRSACHEPDTHDSPRRLARRLDLHALAGSSRASCPLAMRVCTRVNLYCTR